MADQGGGKRRGEVNVRGLLPQFAFDFSTRIASALDGLLYRFLLLPVFLDSYRTFMGEAVTPPALVRTATLAGVCARGRLGAAAAALV